MFVGGVRVGLDVLFFLTENIYVHWQPLLCQARLHSLHHSFGGRDPQQWWRGLPKKINLMSACSGTGLFELCFHQVIEKINDRLFTSGEDRIQACLFQGICQP